MPYLGQIVIVNEDRLTGTQERRAAPRGRPGIITKVNGDGTINAVVFSDRNDGHMGRCTQVVQNRGYSRTPTWGTWREAD
ncbi:MAG TPA: hypothetical protein VKQ05_12890 [Gemmatimonadales bacterium]|nr:hypothetical protein [Gemmatimonadales bacterium]